MWPFTIGITRPSETDINSRLDVANVTGGHILHGVAIVSRPVARFMDDGLTVEIRRVCTDGTYNACSMLYGACSRIACEMGYKRIITYTLVSEPGTSLKASGFTNCGEAGGTDWNVPSRPRETTQVTLFGEERKYPDEKKIRWEKRKNRRSVR